MNKVEVIEAFRAIDRSRAKIVGLDQLLEAYQKNVRPADHETEQVIGAIKLIFFDISVDLEKTRRKLAGSF